jgi:hypothetical protein
MTNRASYYLAGCLVAVIFANSSWGQDAAVTAPAPVSAPVEATQAVSAATEPQVVIEEVPAAPAPTMAITAASNAVQENSAAIEPAPNIPPPATSQAEPVGVPADNTLFGDGESRTQHAMRFNVNLAKVSILILGIFILCRLVLLWQINRNRKKISRDENAFEG